MEEGAMPKNTRDRMIKIIVIFILSFFVLSIFLPMLPWGQF